MSQTLASQFCQRQQRADRAGDPASDRRSECRRRPRATATTRGRRVRARASRSTSARTSESFSRSTARAQTSRRSSSLLRPWEAVLGAGDGAPADRRMRRVRAFCRIEGDCRFATRDGKLRPADLEPYLHAGASSTSRSRARSRSRRRRSSADVYEIDELRELCAFRARSRPDRASRRRASRERRGRAGHDLRATSVDAGVDVLTFGGTKNGLMLGEAICFFEPEPARRRGGVRAEAVDAAGFEDALHCRAVRGAPHRRPLAKLRRARQRDDRAASRAHRKHSTALRDHPAGPLQRDLRDARAARRSNGSGASSSSTSSTSRCPRCAG